MPIFVIDKKMYCTNIVDEYYDNIAKNYEQYIGQHIEKVAKSLSKDHIVTKYNIKDLANGNIVLWENKKDKRAHVTGYNENFFYYSSPQGIKSKPLKIMYRSNLKPKYIIKLGG